MNFFCFEILGSSEDSLMAAGSFLIHALKLRLLANATLKQNAKIRGLDGIRHTGHGTMAEISEFCPKIMNFFFFGLRYDSQ